MMAAACGPTPIELLRADGVRSLSGVSVVDAAFMQTTVEPTAAESGCLPRSVDAPIAAFGVYEGARSVNVSLGEAGHETNIISVTGDAAGPPRTLLLMAYEPVVWDFSNAPLARIRGVIVAGYYAQALANLPPNIPVAFSARANGGAQSCDGVSYAYRGGPELERAVAAVERATGAEVVSFAGAYRAGAVVLGEPAKVSDETPEVRSGAIRAAVAVSNQDVAPRDAGIRQLLDRGIIRRATPADIAAWNEAATRRLHSGHLAPYHAEHLHVFDAYVVLAPMETPPGMYGAHSSSFIVSRGVPVPTDRGSHNTYYLLEDGTCRGVDPECSTLAAQQIELPASVSVDCEVVPQNQIALQPIGRGPARLIRIMCHQPPGSPFGMSALVVSADARRVARVFYPGEVKVAGLTPGAVWETWSDSISRGQLLDGFNGAVRWDESGVVLWAALQARAGGGGWAAEPVRLARLDNGGVHALPVIANAPGRLDVAQWIGEGVVLAHFDTRGGYYRPERTDPHPTLAMVDARHGRILGAVSFAALRNLSDDPLFANRPPAVARLADGRFRILLGARNWVVWTQGEPPRAVDNPYDRGSAVLTPDGSAVLVSQMLEARGPICEHDPHCPAPTPEAGVWAALYDHEHGRAMWIMNGRAENFGDLRSPPVIRGDGRYALMLLPPTNQGAQIALISMRDGAILQRFPGVRSFGFARGGRLLWIEYGGLLALYTLAD